MAEKGKVEKEKTNVMRILDSRNIKYESFCYVETGETNGEKVAAILGENPDCVFKTLVTVGKTGTNYVFVIPVNKELDLKKAAKVVGEKSIGLIKAKELLPLTGYIHGGCSPIGMKKVFKTTVHITAREYESIFFSAGKVGYQISMTCNDLEKVIRLQYADVTADAVVNGMVYLEK